jgi:hypothetical protein
MPTYNTFQLKVKPTLNNKLYAKVSGGTATVLVIDDDAKNAIARAKHHVEKAGWEISEVTIWPTYTEEIPSDNAEMIQMKRTAKIRGIGAIYDVGIGGGAIFN